MHFRSDSMIRRLTLGCLLIAAGTIAASIPQLSTPFLGESPEKASGKPIGITLEGLDRMQRFPGRLSALPPPPIPADNPQTSSKTALGQMLFFDTRLSGDNSVSCSTCHSPDHAFSDGRQKALGIGKNELARRAPSILNAAYNSFQFWDGRAQTLEEQAEAPILNPNEMGMPDDTTLIKRISQIPQYQKSFRQVFGGNISLANVAKAIAAFERTLVTPDSAFDRYVRGDKSALSVEQKRGLILFFDKGACSLCHNGPNFTDNNFYSLGRVSLTALDEGRFFITKEPAMRYAFKTPSLRNVVLRPPYTHDGSVETLREMLDLYARGGGDGKKCSLLRKIDFSEQEKTDLISFLAALTGTLPSASKPKLP